jgi:rRNA biogenesis protein RRP5
VDVEKNQVEMSFRSGNLRRDSDSLSLADIREGQIINGRIKKIEDYGLFIEIDGSKLSGLCHKSQVSSRVTLL